jgi:hypothetical protein
MSSRLGSTLTCAHIGRLGAAAVSKARRVRVTLFGAALGLLLTTVGCESPYLTEQPDPRLEKKIADLQDRVAMLVQEIANLERTYWSEKICQKSKDKITSFVNGLQKGTPEVCMPMEVEKALAFMSSQPVAYVYLDKTSRLSSLHPARKGYIQNSLLKEENIHPSTRILIVVQPYSDTSAAILDSQALGQTMADTIRSWLPTTPNRTLPILGPYLLPCNLQSEAALAKIYTGSQFTKLNETLPGEPTAKQPRVRIWIFRTDCQ